nr:MAG TPA: hypothetical protein [Bacteriophage sp.]
MRNSDIKSYEGEYVKFPGYKIPPDECIRMK